MQPHITAIGLQLARFYLIIEETRQNIVHHFFARSGRINGEGNLDPPIKITRHPIRAGEINVGLAGVFKIINAAVLEKTSDDADDPNVFTQARHSRSQTTNPADDEIDFYARARGLIKFLDDIVVNERI